MSAQIVLLLLALTLTLAQDFLPKERNNLPINDLYTNNMARVG